MARKRWYERSAQPVEFVASGQLVNISSDAAVKRIIESRQKWFEQAWETYDVVGEVKYGVNVLAALVSRVVYFPAERPAAHDAHPVRTSNAEAIDTFERLGDPVALSDLIREMAINLLVVGECYLICFGERVTVIDDGGTRVPGRPETWVIRSIDEITIKDGKVKVLDIDNSDTVERWVELEQSKGDAFIRIWRPHARKHHQADSHVRGILSAAEELLWWDAASVARAQSRMSDTGILEIPSDIELPAESEDDLKLTGAQRTAKKIQDAVVASIKNPRTAGSVAPITITYPANDSRKSGINHLKIERPQDELLEKRTDRCLQRIEQGMNLPVGVVSGLGQATHWGGGQIEESTFREHVEPLVLLIVSALTKAFLQPLLTDDENPEQNSKIIVWYDNSNLIIHTDKATNAHRALELGGIGWPAYRRELGYSEHDAPSDKERELIREWLQSVRSSQKQGIVENPQKPTDPDDPSAPPKENPPGKRTPTEQPSAPLKRKGQSPVAASVAVLADERIRNSIAKAGNKLKNRAKKVPNYHAAVRDIEPLLVPSTLGAKACTTLGVDDIFDGCFDGFTDRVWSISEGMVDALAFRPFVETIAATCLYAQLPQTLLISASDVEDYFLDRQGVA